MKVCIFGLGYVGLATAAVLSSLGHNVDAVDRNKARITELNDGRIPFFEPELAEKLNECFKKERLRYLHDKANLQSFYDVIVIAVGTPLSSAGRSDLSSVEQVIKSIGKHLLQKNDAFTVIMIRSTVPPGTCEKMKQKLLALGIAKERFALCAHPEFFQEGQVVQNAFHPRQIIFGCNERAGIEKAKALYHGLEAPICITDPLTAEIIKYAANAFLAVKISFANELADICSSFGARVDTVTKAIGGDPRIGPDFLNAGLGFGGSCLPKDLRTFIQAAEDSGLTPRLLAAAETVNEKRVERYIQLIETELGTLQHKTIAVWGLTFKPGTDDIRHSQAIALVQALKAKKAHVPAYDPKAPHELLPFSVCKSMYEAVAEADALVIATEWDCFIHANWAKVRQLMRGDLVIPARNGLKNEVVTSHGLRIKGVGLP